MQKITHTLLQPRWWFFCIPLIFLLVFLVLPQTVMIGYSLHVSDAYNISKGDLTLINYQRFFGLDDPEMGFDPVYLNILWRSVRMAALTTLFCLLIGYPLALWMALQPPRRAAVAVFLVTLPLFANGLIRILTWMLVLAKQGIANKFMLTLGLIDEPMQLMFTEKAVFIGLVYTFLPFMVLPLYASLEKLDKRLIEASFDLGAGVWRTFCRIILPLSGPGILAGSTLVLIPCLGAFTVPALLGGSNSMMLGSLIEQQFLYSRDWPFGAAVTLCTILIIALVGLFLYATKKRLGRVTSINQTDQALS
jgi:spermidine/putrescine transport system permease protein